MNRSGKLKKSISVYSNDPRKKREHLTIEASIKPLIKLMPSRSVTLRGKPGETKSRVLTISAGSDRPLKIKPGKFTLEGKVSFALEEIEEGKQYKITFKNNPDVSGNFPGGLKLSTNYKEKPEIKIRIYSRFN